MTRRNIQQPRAPGQPRCLVASDRRLQLPRLPSEGRCFADYRHNFAEGGTGEVTRQQALNALADAANGTAGYFLGKDVTTGNVVFQDPGGAPNDETFLVRTITGSLANGIEVKDSATIEADWSTPGEVTFNVVSP